MTDGVTTGSLVDAGTVRLTHVTKRFGRRHPVTALDSVSITLPSHCVCALIGENGAGKSTLLRVIAGTITPDRGTVIRPERVGVLLGNNFGLYDRLTAREYLGYIGGLRGLSGPELAGRIDTVVDQLNIGAFVNRRCGGFSAGMRQRTALAASILHRPELVLLDEPTTGLDIAVRDHVISAIRDMAAAGHSMIISTHHPEEIREIATEAIIMRAGTIARRLNGSDPELRGTDGMARAAMAVVRGSVSG
jgi:ABC-type multidrug transport system ATPase subunit